MIIQNAAAFCRVVWTDLHEMSVSSTEVVSYVVLNFSESDTQTGANVVLQLHKWTVANVQGSTIYSDTAAANYKKAGLEGVFESQIPNIPAKRLGTTEEV